MCLLLSATLLLHFAASRLSAKTCLSLPEEKKKKMRRRRGRKTSRRARELISGAANSRGRWSMCWDERRNGSSDLLRLSLVCLARFSGRSVCFTLVPPQHPEHRGGGWEPEDLEDLEEQFEGQGRLMQYTQPPAWGAGGLAVLPWLNLGHVLLHVLQTLKPLILKVLIHENKRRKKISAY